MSCDGKENVKMGESLYDYCIERDEVILLGQWDKDKNGELTAHDVSYGSHTKVWWRCDANHLWETPVYSRTLYSTGCPYCTGKKLPPHSRTLASEFPQLLKEWHPTLNTDVSPDKIAPYIHRKVWWVCAKGHEWQAQVASRARGSGCPYCSNRKIIAGENDLATTHPEIAAQWHPTKNEITPNNVVAGNHVKVWWVCDKGHEWQAKISSRTSDGCGCPVCAGKVVVPGYNDLASAYPAIASQWHPIKNGALIPSRVTPYSNRKAWWICDEGHEYNSLISHRVQNAAGCPYCSGKKVLTGFNDLATKAPRLCSEWDRELNGTLTPQMVTASSHKKVWWRCPADHVWKAVVSSRTGARQHGCPVCAGKARAAKVWTYERIIQNARAQ